MAVYSEGCSSRDSKGSAVRLGYLQNDLHHLPAFVALEKGFFGKEGIEEGASRDGIKKRHYPRVDTLFLADFKYHPGHNETISGRATIRNLSEEGVFAEQIMAVSTKSGETIKQSKMSGQELYDIKFRLNGCSESIKIRGICTREIKAEDKYCAGIRFKDMEKDQKGMINNYVINTYIAYFSNKKLKQKYDKFESSKKETKNESIKT